MTEKEFDALWKDLVTRSHRPEGFPLSEYERHFYAVNLLRGSVPRSGFIGYFENWSGSEIADAHEGLRVLRLEAVLGLLQKAQHTVFGDRPLPKDSSPIEIFPASLTAEEYEKESDKLDDALNPIQEAFYTHDEEIWRALCNFAVLHALKPKG